MAWSIDSRSQRLRWSSGREAVDQVLDAGFALVAPFFDDVRGAIVEGELLTRLVAAHDDDPLCAELARRDYGVEACGAVAPTTIVSRRPH